MRALEPMRFLTSLSAFLVALSTAYGEQLQASRALCKHVGPGMHTCDCQPGFACADGPPAGVCTGEVCVEVGEEAQTLRLKNPEGLLFSNDAISTVFARLEERLEDAEQATGTAGAR